MWAHWYGPLVERVRAWANAEPEVRAVLMVGSQARTHVPADEWSDLDLVIFHTDPPRLLASTEWFRPFGTVVLSMLEPTAVLGMQERRVLYAEGRDVDFAVFPAAALPVITARPEALAVLSRGFVILLDKDQQLVELPSRLAGRSTEAAGGPTEEQFLANVADFWYHVLWTVKKLRRGEIWSAKMGCDGYLKRLLVQMIEWQSLTQKGGKADVWHDGRFLDQWADPTVKARLPRTFAQYEPKDLARAPGETGRLFSDIAREVALAGGWEYPASAEEAVSKLVRKVEESP
jgi:aminoglycoside 6-adenylyltransferase